MSSTDTALPENDQIIPVDEATLAEYETGAAEVDDTPSFGLKTPPPGDYSLRLPEVFEVKPTNARTAIGVLFTTAGHPVTIVGGPHEGYEMRRLRLYTTMGQGGRESAVGALLRNFGVTREELHKLYRSGSIAAWRDTIAQFAGQVTPHAVRCDWYGEDWQLAKALREEGLSEKEIKARTRYRGMGPARKQGGMPRFDVALPGGGFQSFIETDRPDPKNPERKLRVYANLEPVFDGFLVNVPKA